MNRSQYWAMLLDLKENPQRLPEYRERYRNVYPFSDGMFKLLLANESKPERTIKFLNAIFDIYGYSADGEPILIEVQQNSNVLYVDRVVYYTSRVVCNQVRKAQDYNLPHIYVLSLLCDDQFPLEPDTYFHHCQVVRNRKFPFEKINVYLVEMEKFFAIDDRREEGQRERSDRAEMLRLFRDVLEDKTVDEEKASRLLDNDFVKDVSFQSCTDELLLLEVGNMTDMLYEKQGSYLQGKAEGKAEGREEGLAEGHEKGADFKNKELAKGFRDDGVSIEVIAKRTGLTPEEIKAL